MTIQSSATISTHITLSLMHHYTLQSLSNTWYHDWTECVHSLLWRGQRSETNTGCSTDTVISICNKRTSNFNMKHIVTSITTARKYLANRQSVHSKIKSNKQRLRSVGITVYTTSIVILVSMYWQNWSTYLTNGTRRQTQCNSWLAEGTVKFTPPCTTEMNFATPQNLVVNSTMFPHQNFDKYTRTSLDGKTHNKIDHILIDKRRHSSVLDVWSFSGADWDTDHCLVVAEFRERLAVGKQAAQRFDGERLNLRKLWAEG